jgi:hypothetical protein
MRVKLKEQWRRIFIVDVDSDLDNKRICKNKY